MFLSLFDDNPAVGRAFCPPSAALRVTAVTPAQTTSPPLAATRYRADPVQEMQRLCRPSQVRDFRGAMTGRAGKGIIITTGSFTSEARKEAVGDGAPPIELVDGEKLAGMLEGLQLGLKPKPTYELDGSFFSQFAK